MHHVVLHGSDMLMWIGQCANALCRAFQLKIDEVGPPTCSCDSTRLVS